MADSAPSLIPRGRAEPARVSSPPRPLTKSTGREPRDEPFVEVGRIGRPWGLHGEIQVQELTDVKSRFADGSELYVRGQPHRVERSRRHQRGRILKLAGIDSQDAARQLQGAALEVPESALDSLPDDTYYHYHLVGMEVVTDDEEPLGTLVEVFSTGSNDVYVVEGPKGQILLPAIADVVKKVDVPGRVMTVVLLPGLV